MRWVALWLLCAPAVWADPAILQADNAERAAQGRSLLAYDARHDAVARSHGAGEQRTGFFAHEGSDGSNLGDRLRRSDVSFCFAAENIARGQQNLAEVMQGWMGSRGHRRNILHRRAETVGVARVRDIWVMVLAAPC